MIFDFIGDIFFPRTCVACRSAVPASVVCDDCFAGIARNKIFGAAAEYKDKTVQALIHALKFQGVRDAAAPLAILLADHAATSAETLRSDGYCVVPIPLSRRRERARGFNQSTLIAKQFAVLLEMPFEKNMVVRVRHSKPQSETASLAERTTNLRGCFAVPDPVFARGKNILLIDDVTTSGTTFREATSALKAAGAGKVIALACAKA